MSLLSRNELRIVLYPDRIALLRTGRMLTLRGYKRSVHAMEDIACVAAGDGAALWSSAVTTLGLALPRFARRNMEANVILSNQFVHYALVPWLDKLSEEEEMIFAQHGFREVYGSAADSWSVRVSPGRAGGASLASAVDAKLLDELRGLLGRMKLDINSIQPHLMAAFNSCQTSLDGRSAWIALLEPGNLCLAVQQKGQLAWIRKMQIGEAWHKELPTILEREAYLADAGMEMDEVLLWAPHLKDLDIPAGGRWQIRQLKPGKESGFELEYGGLHTLAAGA